MRAIELAQQLRAQPKPFLKWAGGKAKLAPKILAHFPERFKRYHEPFIGGGAIFFTLGPRMATLSDINDDLVNTYITIRDNVEALIDELRKHHATEEYFYAVRALVRQEMPLLQSAARTIFLNRTCFNGLYRVNRSGKFNVPFGRYANPKICNADNLRTVADALQGVDLRVEDALAIGQRARRGDLVYFDPPYDPVSTTSSFTSYAKGGFGRDEQVQLAEVFANLADRGVHVVLSNSDTPFIRDLFAGFRIEQVFVRRPINSRADRRGPVPEVLVSAT